MAAAAEEERLQALRQKLGRKQHFGEAVADLAATLRDRYADASPALRKSMYSTVCRVATVLHTRYTAPGFWRAGLNLFIGTEKLVTNPSEKEHLKTCILRAQEHLDEKENEESMPSNREADSRFLFEGHLTVGPEPPPPAWLIAQNLARELSILSEPSGDQDGNNNRTEFRPEEMTPAIMNFLNTISADRDLETALEESLQLEMLGPAVTGTRNVLKAASAANVRRVVIVSSMVAVEINPKDWPKDKIKDENCWSDKEFCRNNENWYSVAKITAEEAALEYGRQTGLDVVTINPALVFGPLLQPMLNTSCQFLVYLLKGGPDQMRNKLWHIVDVRDTADALLLVYEAPEASGRHICAPHFISARDLLDLVKSMYPDYPFISKESICDMDHPAPMTSDKLKKLGWSCRPLKETITDTVEFCKQAGFLEDVEGTPCRFPPLFNKI